MKQMELTNLKEPTFLYEITRKRLDMPRMQVKSPSVAYEYAVKTFNMKNIDYELLVAIMLDTKNQITGTYIVSRGLVDRSHLHAREVFRTAISLACSKIIMVHNHPSGDSAPSKQDISVTRELVKAGHIIGIEIIDHIIVGEEKEFSFKENDLLEE